MKARDIIGKKVVEVEQYRFTTSHGTVATGLLAIKLDNGTRIVFHGVDDEDNYHVQTTVQKKDRRWDGDQD